MKEKDQTLPNQRRDFFKKIATGAAVLGAGSMLTAPLQLSAADHPISDVSEADMWFNKLKGKGKHKIVFDVIEPRGIFPFAWPKIFIVTNGATGTAEKDCGVVVFLRHSGIPFAMNNDLWAIY